jgi:hypothetical protein
MNHLFVFAEFSNGFGMELDKITLKRGDVSLELSNEDWEEIHQTLKGKRGMATTELAEGSYYPKNVIVWNDPPNDVWSTNYVGKAQQ